MQMKKSCTAMILVGTAGGVLLVAGAVLAVRNTKSYRAMRAVRRTNAVIRRVGHVLSAVASATEECV